jgi:hypothetical protein
VPLLSAILVGASGLADVRADQLLTGKKLLIKNPPAGPTTKELVHLGKDARITIGAAGGSGDPQCAGADGGGGSLRIEPSDGCCSSWRSCTSSSG